jgi:succinyl-diaminopimelate desuccinylase
MKSGVAAMLIAAINVSEKNLPKGGIKIVITAGEENGCEGARNLRESGYPIGGARCLIVGEPTSNVPYVGHKGGLFLYARAQGLTAHSSKPEIGDNAVYKVARAITKVEKLTFCGERDPLLGIPTINVGLVSGGQNFNSVPDSAEFTIDVRTTSEFTNAYALELLKKELTSEITLEPFVDLKPVTNDIEHPMIQKVLKICMARTGQDYGARAIGYLTDGSVLQSWMGDVPTVILGPGDPGMAHKTDEHCCVHKIREAVSIYEDIITNV